MTTLTWLHLSDLHFKEKDKWDEDIVLKALLRDVEKQVDKEGLQPDFIAVTGDIASKASVEEYEHAKGFFDKLLSKTYLEKNRLFIVPG